MTERTRPRKQLTFSKDVYHYLDQPEINASRLVEAAIRDKVSEKHINRAASNAGMTSDEIEEARE